MTERRYRVWLAALVAAATLVYASTLDAGFTFDDTQSIRGHVGVHGPFSLTNILLRDFWGLTFDKTVGTWRPVATLTYWLDWHLGSGRPWMFHLTNLIVHVALLLTASALLARFAGDVLGPRARLLTLAAFAALVIHVDVVPSATGRAEMLAALFVLLAAWVALGGDGAPKWWEIGAASGLLGLGLLSKESAFPMALVVPYLAARRHHARGKLEPKKVVALFAACLAVLGAVIAFRLGRLPFGKGGQFQILPDNYLHALSWGQQKLGACEVLTHYLEHTLTGLDLVIDYSYSSIHVATSGVSPRAALGMLCYAALALIVALGHRRLPAAADAVVGFMGAFLVASHLVVPASAMVADRLFFFPSFWLTVLIAVLIARIPTATPSSEGRRTIGPRNLVVFAAVGLTITQALIAAAAATNWHDDATLLTQALQTRPHVARSRVNLSMVLHAAGRHDESAWHAALAHAYYTHFPDAVPESAYPLAWDDLPMPERLERLRASLGDPKYAAVLRRTERSCRTWHLDQAAPVVRSWLARLPADIPELPTPLLGAEE